MARSVWVADTYQIILLWYLSLFEHFSVQSRCTVIVYYASSLTRSLLELRGRARKLVRKEACSRIAQIEMLPNMTGVETLYEAKLRTSTYNGYLSLKKGRNSYGENGVVKWCGKTIIGGEEDILVRKCARKRSPGRLLWHLEASVFGWALDLLIHSKAVHFLRAVVLKLLSADLHRFIHHVRRRQQPRWYSHCGATRCRRVGN